MTVLPVPYCPECDLPHALSTCPRCGYSVVDELNDLLAEQGEPRTCLEELERLPDWQAERRPA